MTAFLDLAITGHCIFILLKIPRDGISHAVAVLKFCCILGFRTIVDVYFSVKLNKVDSIRFLILCQDSENGRACVEIMMVDTEEE